MCVACRAHSSMTGRTARAPCGRLVSHEARSTPFRRHGSANPTAAAPAPVPGPHAPNRRRPTSRRLPSRSCSASCTLVPDTRSSGTHTHSGGGSTPTQQCSGQSTPCRMRHRIARSVSRSVHVAGLERRRVLCQLHGAWDEATGKFTVNEHVSLEPVLPLHPGWKPPPPDHGAEALEGERRPVQMWQRRAQSRCRCGSGEPGPGADVETASQRRRSGQRECQ